MNTQSDKNRDLLEEEGHKAGLWNDISTEIPWNEAKDDENIKWAIRNLRFRSLRGPTLQGMI